MDFYQELKRQCGFHILPSHPARCAFARRRVTRNLSVQRQWRCETGATLQQEHGALGRKAGIVRREGDEVRLVAVLDQVFFRLCTCCSFLDMVWN